MQRIIFLGPPACGKGTQSERVAQALGIPLVSTGAMFRHEIAQGSEMGKVVEEIVKSGQLVPDELTNQLIAKRLREKDMAHGFVLDGYPRNIIQAKALDKVAQPTMLIEIHVSDEESIARISGRRVDSKTGKTYHLKYNPPPAEIMEQLIIRQDDRLESILKRLELYHQQTEPLVEHYADVHHRINGEQEIEAVARDIKKVVGY